MVSAAVILDLSAAGHLPELGLKSPKSAPPIPEQKPQQPQQQQQQQQQHQPLKCAGTTDLPYWQVNVPPDHRTDECPEFLCNLSAKDRGIIGTPESECPTASWEDVCGYVATNQLDQFQRRPLQLRQYLAYAWELKKTHGSALNFLLRERLCWSVDELSAGAGSRAPETEAVKRASGMTKTAAAFACPHNVKILWNDWPYGIDKRVVHLVVWTKFLLDEDPATGDPTDEVRTAISDFVEAKFGELPKDSYIWFRNWKSLRSVLQLEHFHVMLYDPPLALVDKVTGGDVPLFKRVQREVDERGS